MLTHRLPYPPDRGDRIRSFNLLKVLASRYDVSIACTSEETVWLQHHQLLSTMAKNVAIYPISPTFSKLKIPGALLRGQAITPQWHYRQGLADTIAQWHQKDPFDAVLTFCTGMAQYTKALMQSIEGLPIPYHILDLVDVDSVKWKSYAKQAMAPKKWIYAAEAKNLRKIEACQENPYDAITVVSQAEAETYQQHVTKNDKLHVVGNGVDFKYFGEQPPAKEEKQFNIIFVGVLNYLPNAQCIEWFVHNVMKPLRQRNPRVVFQVVGRHPTSKINDLGKIPGVEIIGSVPDVRQYLADASLVIAPLRIARGIQNKVLEAMSSQRTVVCSPAAAQGIKAEDGKHFFLADKPNQWVDTIDQLLKDPKQRQAVGQAAREQVIQQYSWQQALDPMIQLIENRTKKKPQNESAA